MIRTVDTMKPKEEDTLAKVFLTTYSFFSLLACARYFFTYLLTYIHCYFSVIIQQVEMTGVIKITKDKTVKPLINSDKVNIYGLFLTKIRLDHT